MSKVNSNKKLSPELFAIYFSPYSAHALKIDGVVYPTLEHAYQCKRYKEQKIIEEILNAPSPMLAWETSCKYKHLTIPEFTENKLKIMEELMRCKTEQHREIQKALIDSKDLKIVKHITTYPPGDGFWCDGEDGKGLNHIGRLWMKIRSGLLNS